MTTPFQTQKRLANTVYAGPATGDKKEGEFRKLVVADIPTLPPNPYFAVHFPGFNTMTVLGNPVATHDQHHFSFFQHTGAKNYFSGSLGAEAIDYVDTYKFKPKIKGIYSVELHAYDLKITSNTGDWLDQSVFICKNVDTSRWYGYQIPHDTIAASRIKLQDEDGANASHPIGQFNDAHINGTVYLDGVNDYITFMYKSILNANYVDGGNSDCNAAIKLLTRC